MRLLNLAVLFLLSCSGSPSPTLDLTHSVAVNESRVDALRRVKKAVCKVELPSGGHGSGVAFDSQGSWIYILTAAHVVPLAADIRLSVLYTINSTDIRQPAEIVYVSKVSDLAILRVQDCFMEFLDLAEHDTEPDEPVLTLGFPNDVHPVCVTYGFVLGYGDDCLVTSAPLWYGNSGGPVLDFKTLEIIGINVHFPFISAPMRGDQGHAERLSRIKDLLKFLAAIGGAK